MEVFVEEAEKEGVEHKVVAEQEMETGSEDSPDAYRWTPADEEDQNINVVAVFNPHTEEWGYQECWGNLFGLTSAVWNYNHTPKLLQALYRR